MKIAIATSENHIKSHVDPYFGRCNWFCFFDTESQNIEFIENSSRNNQEKAGFDAVELLISKGINIAIAKRFGAKVVDLFRAKNIQMIIPDEEKTIKDIINQVK
jgi:predicted Fe-Mo cluster-binding NifX family protein